jgi:hypothetical protein
MPAYIVGAIMGCVYIVALLWWGIYSRKQRHVFIENQQILSRA